MSLITSSFGFDSTAEEVANGIDLTGRRAVVTGAASGIGIETARVLASRGADVTLAVRNPDAGRQAAERIIAETGNPAVHVARLDVADLASVERFVADWSGPLHILVNNAGIMATPEERTASGIELQFATNFLGHFALAVGLHDALTEARGARVVSLSSSGHLISPVVFDDIDFRFRPYDPLLAYGQSKTASVLFAVGAAKRWADDGITVNAVMPGAIATGLQKHTGGLKTPPEGRKSVEQGAATSIFVATSPLLEGISGRYFEDNNEAVTVHDGNGWMSGVAAYALDEANANRLWDLALQLIQPGRGTESRQEGTR
ncbi:MULTISPECIES: SDR family NAD(P)-dependent oxidoreductase [unclassified Leifsonia]|uniref:SDR family NAD(P)-dependent oxidoreductase n=1 Tax=unclassified Leifsonia TaxID=2663824 RepID=UPI0006FE3F50|nr:MULTISPECIES: SDR family NAD(P)-dependent oxidoreductase [unclassified Leifsonia]KQX07656.1 oxidoreductase [Leifsonia sp. Root1293]KRA11938.1 oxidoreductase [Leifsonia sp. Root60]